MISAGAEMMVLGPVGITARLNHLMSRTDGDTEFAAGVSLTVGPR